MLCGPRTSARRGRCCEPALLWAPWGYEGVSLIVVIADWLCRVLSRARWARTCYTPVGRQRTTWSPQSGISLKARDASRGSDPPPALPHSIPCLRHQGPGPLRLRRERGAGSPRRSGLWVFLVERGSESAEPLAHWAPNAMPPQLLRVCPPWPSVHQRGASATEASRMQSLALGCSGSPLQLLPL